MGRAWGVGFLAPRFFGSFSFTGAALPSLAAAAQRNGSSICKRRIASLGGCFRDLLARFFINSVLRSRIFTSNATTAVTSAPIAPLATMSAMNFPTASRSGANALVMGGVFGALVSDIARAT